MLPVQSSNRSVRDSGPEALTEAFWVLVTILFFDFDHLTIKAMVITIFSNINFSNSARTK